MSEVLLRSRSLQRDDFCSQGSTPIPAIQTIEEGVKIIEDILRKEVLCTHDINNINQVYKKIDLLEKQVTSLPKANSKDALTKIIEKVQKLVGAKRAEDLISLYHLQKLSDPDMPIVQVFKEVVSKKEVPSEAIAEQLPYCISCAQFEKDIESLLGSNKTSKSERLLKRKKEELNKYENKTKEILKKKVELDELRKKNPQEYPAYLEMLLEAGYLYLYNHLIAMKTFATRNDRRSAIEKMSFSEFSHIVLETQEAVIKQIVSSIPAHLNNILFLLGGSGAGKSTTLCFLRGDDMVLENNSYKSRSDKQKLIGDQGATSCTFLPSIEIVNDLVIVDFPGFDDTNGPAISLGMEFALKALIKKYNPNILVLESITNVQGRFAAAAQLGVRLRRLLGDTKNCMLGITKYSIDSDFKDIKALEKQQRRELSAPTEEEQELIAEIKILTKRKENSDEEQKKLQKLQQARMQSQLSSLPDTDEKVKSKKSLEEKEKELAKQIGIPQIIRFDELESKSNLSFCLAEISKKPPDGQTKGKPDHSLDPEDEHLLDILFENSLKKQLEVKADYYEEEINNFEQSVLESSLINTIFSITNPEIGLLLHSSEMDPKVIRNYDRKIVGSCIKRYMGYVISSINASLFNKIITSMEAKAPPKKVKALNHKLEIVRDYVMGLLGAPIPEDPNKAEAEWARIQQEHQAANEAVEERFKLPMWAQIGMGIPLGIPLGIFTLIKWNKQSQASQEAVEKTIDTCCQDLDRIYDTLLKLKNIEKIIEKKEALDEALISMPISTDSEETFRSSMQKRIDKVRSVYGSEDWDKRISFLMRNFELVNVDLNNPSDVDRIMWQIRDLILLEGVKEKRADSVGYAQGAGVIEMLEISVKMARLAVRIFSLPRLSLIKPLNRGDLPLIRTMYAAAIFSQLFKKK